MCYRALEQQTRNSSDETRATRAQRSRSRWVAVAVAILAATAFAAILAVPGVRDASAGERVAGPQHVATVVPQQGTVDTSSKTSLPADDGVPTTADASMAAGHPCHHGL